MGREDDIRRRAHEIWEREGRPHGRDQDHWHQAMRETDAPIPKTATKAAAVKKPTAKKPAKG